MTEEIKNNETLEEDITVDEEKPLIQFNLSDPLQLKETGFLVKFRKKFTGINDLEMKNKLTQRMEYTKDGQAKFKGFDPTYFETECKYYIEGISSDNGKTYKVVNYQHVNKILNTELETRILEVIFKKIDEERKKKEEEELKKYGLA